MPSALVMTLFEEEIDDIVTDFPDLIDIFEDGQSGKITINREVITGKYVYKIDKGSMSRRDESAEIESLSQLLRQVLNGAQIEPQSGELVSPIIKAFEASGKKLDVAEMFKRIIIGAGVSDWDKIILDREEVLSQPQEQEKMLSQEMDQFLGGVSQQGGQPQQQGGMQPQQGPMR